MATTTIKARDNRPVTLTHKALCWYARLLIERRMDLGLVKPKKTYGADYDAAVARLRQNRVSFTPPSDTRREKMITDPRDLTSDELFFLKEAIRVWFSNKVEPEAQIACLKAAEQKYPLDGTVDSNGLGQRRKARYGPQTNLRTHFVGTYLVIRNVYSIRKWLVSRMDIRTPKRPNGPGFFETRGPSGGVHLDDSLVTGEFHESPDTKGYFFAHGFVNASVDFRSTILEAKTLGHLPDTPVELQRQKTVQDLAGLRLGLGHADGKPRGYRIWCSRIIGATDAGIDACVGTFNYDDEMQIVANLVAGLRYIQKWLHPSKYVVLSDE